jgi:hypothetical protein
VGRAPTYIPVYDQKNMCFDCCGTSRLHDKVAELALHIFIQQQARKRRKNKGREKRKQGTTCKKTSKRKKKSTRTIIFEQRKEPNKKNTRQKTREKTEQKDGIWRQKGQHGPGKS